MTVLDGLLDEAYEVIAPDLNLLVDLVVCGRGGEDIPAGNHLFHALCFAIARFWVRKLNEIAPLDGEWRDRFQYAVERSMTAEHEACRSRFENGLPDHADALWDRTRWPRWCQALVCEAPHAWPSRFYHEAMIESGVAEAARCGAGEAHAGTLMPELLPAEKRACLIDRCNGMGLRPAWRQLSGVLSASLKEKTIWQ
jgi:hypothetical protein